MRPILLSLALLLSSPVTAQVVGECNPALAQADSIVEPWEDNTLTVSAGEVRLAVLDAIEPGAVPYHLLILTPPYGELGARMCWLVSQGAGGIGFSSLTLAGRSVATDAIGRVTLVLQAGTFNDITGVSDPATLSLTIDPSTGVVTAQMP